jgi:spermidine/putrescine transport system substrate-binding protein
MTDEQLTRRQLLERGALGAAAISLPALLAACGGSSGIKGGAQTTAATTATVDRTLAKTLTISNWPLYIDIDEKTKKRPTIEQFEKEFNVTVKYIEDVNDNDQFYGKVQAQLRGGQSIGRDIMVLTDWMAARMVRLGWVEPLDKQSIPNAKNLVAALASPGWDPQRTYSLPWQSGMTGIGYNPDKVGGEIDSVEQLLTDPKLKGKVTLLTEMADCVSLVMLANGDDPTKVDDTSFQKALTRIKKAVDSGQVRQFTGNDYSGPLSKGDLAAAMSWSGDVVQLTADNKNLVWNLPESGGDIWTDNMLIPKGGDVFTASTFMNFVYDPKIAAQIAAYVNYITPVKGAKEEAAKLDPELAKNPLIFPDAATLSKVKIFDSEALSNQDYAEKWQALIGA